MAFLRVPRNARSLFRVPKLFPVVQIPPNLHSSVILRFGAWGPADDEVVCGVSRAKDLQIPIP